MKTIYVKYRDDFPNKYAKAPETLDIKYHFEKVHQDKLSFVTISLPINNSQYKPLNENGKRLAVVTFDEAKITEADLTYDLQDLPNHARVLTPAEAIDLVQDASDRTLKTWTTNTFEISPEWMDEQWQAINAVNLTIQ